MNTYVAFNASAALSYSQTSCRVAILYLSFRASQVYNTQGVPEEMDKTSGECSLC